MRVHAILARGPYSTRACRRCPAQAPFKLSHHFEDGSTAEFLVTDNPLKRPADMWPSVCACFVQGALWQFKDWPFKNETEIFAKMAG